MIKLAGRIHLFEMVFPLFREDLSDKWRKDLNSFVDGYLKENIITLPMLKWTMDCVIDITLDPNAGENVRIGLGKKLLLPMIETCDT